MRESVSPLPIDALIPDLKASLQQTPNLILEAAPGAGKTTRVPPALLDAASSSGQEIWVLEPRRIAARLSARRVAEEMGERLGETVGYQVRFEEISSPRTRLRFLTEGVLTRRLLSNPTLKGVAAVVLDEFHERHLQSDLALALLRRLQQTTRPDLKLIVMSATLDVAPLARYLGDCPVLHSAGQRYEISVEFLKQDDARPLPEQVSSAVARLVQSQLDGNVLVFLPGAAEIKRSLESCQPLATKENVLLLPLHGELPINEQERAVRPASQRKIILSTNVAETSLTIDNVAAVIDSGLARIAAHSPWSGLPTLNVQRISKASATQRAGRAGRTRAGRCLRLYTEMDFAARAEFELPEIQRLDLAGAALELYAAGVTDLAQFAWFEAPTPQAIETATQLLRRLGAVDHKVEITPLGRKMLRFPLHPRQARLLLEAEARGVGARGAVLAALIGARDLRTRSFSSAPKPQRPTIWGESDLFVREEQFTQAQAAPFDPHRVPDPDINLGVAQAIERGRRQLSRLLQQPAADNAPNEKDEKAEEEALLISILAGYPDRVAQKQESDNGQAMSAGSEAVPLLLANGGTAQLAFASVVRKSQFLVAVEAEEKKSQRSSVALVRCASAIRPDWLLDLFPDFVSEKIQVSWNAQRACVDVYSRLLYDQLVLDESKMAAKQVPPELALEIANLLADAALKKGWEHFVDPAALARLQARVAVVQQTLPASSWPELGESSLTEFLKTCCVGKRSFAELEQALNFDAALHSFFSFEQISVLKRMTPERVNLAGRKNVRINYESGKAPWIASRLQDFFGMTAGPTIANGRVALVLHLLAPNQRPVQVTTDLAGFWQRTYPQVRRELSRRYPKHAWPEDPLS
jgi:ATP-dependent helicase HrpB